MPLSRPEVSVMARRTALRNWVIDIDGERRGRAVGWDGEVGCGGRSEGSASGILQGE